MRIRRPALPVRGVDVADGFDVVGEGAGESFIVDIVLDPVKESAADAKDS